LKIAQSATIFIYAARHFRDPKALRSHFGSSLILETNALRKIMKSHFLLSKIVV